MLKQSEIVGMCQKLAYRFGNKNEYDDLVSEGVLVCYEILDKEPDAHPAKLYREAKRRMHDHINIDSLPVSVPAHNVAKRVARNLDTDFSGEMSEESVEWIKSIMSSDNISYYEDFGQGSLDHAQDYEDREFQAYMMTVAVMSLSKTELAILKMRYFDDLTQDEVADALETTQKWVSRHEISAIEKLREKICNNL